MERSYPIKEASRSCQRHVQSVVSHHKTERHLGNHWPHLEGAGQGEKEGDRTHWRLRERVALGRTTRGPPRRAQQGLPGTEEIHQWSINRQEVPSHGKCPGALPSHLCY